MIMQQKNLQLILLGAPGSGKGTQAKQLVSSYGYMHISTGDLLRNEVKKKSELGLRIDGIMQSGQLVDDSIVFTLLKNNCDLNSKKYIFDGFPRNIEQSKVLDRELLSGIPYLVIYFDIDTGILVNRLTQRRVCGGCGAIYNLTTLPSKKSGICDKCSGELQHRKDDKEDVVRERMSVFEQTMKPVFDYYQQKGLLITVDASKNSGEVFSTIQKAIESSQRK